MSESIELLDLSLKLTANLRAAGITSITELETELKDESGFQKKVINCSPKTILKIRAAIKKHKKGPAPPPASDSASASVPVPAPTPTPAPAPAPVKNSESGLRQKPHTKLSEAGLDRRVSRLTYLLLAAVFGIGMIVQFLGREQSLPTTIFMAMILSLAAGLIMFQQFPNTPASIDGEYKETCSKVRARLRGPAAMTVMFLLIQLAAMFIFRGQTVQVYLVANPPIRVTQVSIYYRHPFHEGRPVDGTNATVAIRDLPFWKRDLQVNRVECFGYVTAKQAAGDLPPWSYPITNGAVDIQMVKAEPKEDPFPDAADAQKLMEREGITETRARKQGKFTKDQVSLTIENQADRPITVVAYDCVAAFEKKPNLGGWFQLKDERDIELGEKRPWGNFSKFEQPSGWFAIFVRFEDAGLNRVVQKPIACYNLFNVRDPKLVVTRSGEGGIGFQVDVQQSKLGVSR